MFSPTNAGTQINGDAFLPTNITLLDGSYRIVAFNDGNYNSNGNPNPSSTENSGGGLISFGGGRLVQRDSVATSLALPTNMRRRPIQPL